MPTVIKKVQFAKVLPTNFSTSDNQANRNHCIFNAKKDQKLCEVLCRNDSLEDNNECREICRIASDLSDSNDCPFEKECPEGCPCPKYECKKNSYPAETPVVISTGRVNKTHGFSQRIESYRHLMFMSFNSKVGKIIGTNVKTFDLDSREILKTIFMEGRHFLFRYNNRASYAYIYRFTEKEIWLEMKVKVFDRFNVYNGDLQWAPSRRSRRTTGRIRR